VSSKVVVAAVDGAVEHSVVVIVDPAGAELRVIVAARRAVLV